MTATAHAPTPMNTAKPLPDVANLTPEQIAQIANRLERDDYATVFESLQDWHILRTLAFTRPSVVEPYLHLLDIEPFDEC